MGGRRARFTMRVAKRICEHIAMGATVKAALEKEPLGPSMVTFWRWLDEYPEFGQMYERARKLQADLKVDELSEMADAVLRNPKFAPAYKVASDIFWRQCEIANPEKYGKKIEVSERKVPPSPAQLRSEISRLEKELGVVTIEGKTSDITPHLPEPEEGT